MNKAGTLPKQAKSGVRPSKLERTVEKGISPERVGARINGRTSKKDKKSQKETASFAFTYAATDDNNALAIIDAVRSGISATAFNDIVKDTPFTIAEWASYLQLSERTIQRNQKEQKAFQPIQSERIIELAMLYQYGIEVFGDRANFDVWLNAASIALGGRSPKSLLDTKFGMGMVKDELGRIEHGILA